MTPTAHQAAGSPGTPPSTATPTRREPGWYIPWVVLGLVAVYLLSAVVRMNPPREPFDLELAARLPVVEGGRVKPLETVARVYLRQISHREFFVDEAGQTRPAIEWYLDLVSGGTRGKARKHRIFRIENDQLLAELNLKPREGLRYSIEEFGPKLAELDSKAQAAFLRRKKQQPLDKFEEKLLDLSDKLQLYESLARMSEPLLLPPQSPDEEWQSLGKFRQEVRRGGLIDALKPVQDHLASPERFGRITPEQRKKLLAALSGDNQTQTGGDPATTDQRLLIFLREPVTRLSAEDIQERFLAFAEVMTDAELDRIKTEAESNTEKRLASNRPARLWEKMIEAYRANKPSDFNAALEEYRATALGLVSNHDLNKVRGEAYYNRFAPFYHCTALYVLVGLLCALSWLGRTEPLRKSAFYTLYLTLILHTGALIARMYFQDRWTVFVTNLYSSAIFIGWGCVVLGLILEKLYPIGIGNTIAAVLGVATAIISHNLGAGGDTLEMMQAVLDTNFWLATHVTTVTFGYTATFVAGFIGIAYIARLLATVIRDSFRRGGPAPAAELLVFAASAFGLVSIPVMLVGVGLNSAANFEVLPSYLADILIFLLVAAAAGYALALVFARASSEGLPAADPLTQPRPLPGIARVMDGLALDAESSKKLTQMTYGVVCFATLLSFVGTVLGGIWADQSWGRFWGWDPKENGAVLIVLWNALILHARWCGLARDRSIAVLAVAGNMITAWSWFGTNQLGIGLHAYGFDKRLAIGCRWFWLSQLVIIGLGLIPRSYWSSVSKPRVPTGPDPTGPNLLAGTTTAKSQPPIPGASPVPPVNGHSAPSAAPSGSGKKSAKRR